MPTNLKQLKLDELSVVDNGANPGAKVALWKRKSEDDMTDNTTKASDMNDAEMRRMRELMDKEGMSEKDARSKTLAEMRKDAAGSPGTTTSNQEGNMTPEELEKKLGELDDQVAKQGEQITKLTEERDAEKARADAVEKAAQDAGLEVQKTDDGTVKLAKSEDEYVEFNGEKVAKSALPEPVRKQLEAQAEDIAKFKERDAKAEISKRLGEVTFAKTDELAGALYRLQIGKAAEGDAEAIEKALIAAREQVEKGDLFKEMGSSASGEGSALAEATAKAEELRKSDPQSYPTIEVARSAVWEQDADLKKRYDQERKSAH